MFYDEIDKLIPNISIIYHNFYEEGVFIKRNSGIIFVRFFCDDKELPLSIKDYNITWFVKNLSGYQFNNTRIYPIDNQFEKMYYKNSVQHLEEIYIKLDNELSSINDTSSTMGNVIAKQKSLIYTKLNILRRAKLHPYFARIDLQDAKNPENGISYYIENYNLSDKSNNENIVYSTEIDEWMKNTLGGISIDWRSKEAIPYHDQEMYTNEQSEIKLILRRIYNIKGNLIDYIDDLSSEKDLIDQVSDDRLKKIILNSRMSNIKNIVSSIQTNQFRIINNSPEKNMLIEGCAGSGKTMILAHRLSFWAYRLKDSFDVKNVYVISPTKFLSMETYNIDVADTKNANYYSSLEFNLYLINRIFNELDITFFESNQYVSNNLLSDQIIKSAYSKSSVDSFRDLFQSLNHNNDINLINEFKKYLEFKLNEFLKDSLKMTKNTADVREDYKKYYEILKKDIEQLNFYDLKKYKDNLNFKYGDDLKLNDNLHKLRVELKDAKKNATESIHELLKNHSMFNFFKGLNFHEIDNILNQFIKQSDEDKEYFYYVLEQMTKAIDLSGIKKQELNIQEVIEKIENSNIFNRSKLIKEKKELEKNLKLAKVQRLDNLKKYNLTEDGCTFDEIYENIVNYIQSYDEILDDVYHAKNNVEVLIEKSDLYKIVEKSNRKIDTQMLDVVAKKLNLIKQLLHHQNYLSKLRIENINVEEIIDEIMSIKIHNYKSVMRFFDDYSSFLEKDEVKNINDYMATNDFNLVINFAISFVIDKFKLDNQIDLKENYEFELFIMLELLESLEGYNREKNKWLFIDEIQDYSANEIELYRRLFPQSTFNFFGDMRQSINAKGLNKRSLYIITKKFDKFAIEENYRNSNEVTEYVNSIFNLNMKAIGLDGSVTSGNVNEFFNRLKNKENNIAIIVKENYREKYLKSYNEKFKLNYIGEDSIIDKGKINVFTPLLVKGLEFDYVCVITEGMSENEKYVSFTRALTDLYVVEGNDSN